jgi:hypothetical protein
MGEAAFGTTAATQRTVCGRRRRFETAVRVSRDTVKPLWVISARRALILIHVFVFGWSSQINTYI